MFCLELELLIIALVVFCPTTILLLLFLTKENNVSVLISPPLFAVSVHNISKIERKTYSDMKVIVIEADVSFKSMNRNL